MKDFGNSDNLEIPVEPDEHLITCGRCETIFDALEEESECPRCYGKNNAALIQLHEKQAKERRTNRKVGIGFLVVFVLVVTISLLSFYS